MKSKTTRTPRTQSKAKAPKRVKRATRSAASTPRPDKYERVREALEMATPKQLAELYRSFYHENRRVPPGVRLSAFDAGLLADQLRAILKAKRYPVKLDDHFIHKIYSV